MEHQKIVHAKVKVILNKDLLITQERENLRGQIRNVMGLQKIGHPSLHRKYQKQMERKADRIVNISKKLSK